MSQVLMPKATAVWLVENTTLTFDQNSASIRSRSRRSPMARSRAA